MTVKQGGFNSKCSFYRAGLITGGRGYSTPVRNHKQWVLTSRWLRAPESSKSSSTSNVRSTNTSLVKIKYNRLKYRIAFGRLARRRKKGMRFFRWCRWAPCKAPNVLLCLLVYSILTGRVALETPIHSGDAAGNSRQQAHCSEKAQERQPSRQKLATAGWALQGVSK